MQAEKNFGEQDEKFSREQTVIEAEKWKRGKSQHLQNTGKT